MKKLVDKTKKRGVAIEMAILTMTVVFALSALLVTVNALFTVNTETALASFAVETQLNSLGEDYLSAEKDNIGSAWVLTTDGKEDYDASSTTDGNQITTTTITHVKTQTVLTIKLNATKKVIAWNLN